MFVSLRRAQTWCLHTKLYVVLGAAVNGALYMSSDLFEILEYIKIVFYNAFLRLERF